MSKKTNTAPLNEKDPQMSKEEMNKRREEITELKSQELNVCKHKCLWLNNMLHKKKEELTQTLKKVKLFKKQWLRLLIQNRYETAKVRG
mgnify:CR=1 FL=1